MKLESNLEGSISCSQFDFNGKRLAVVNSDRLIRLYNYNDANLIEVARLDNHLGEILSISWSHPKFHSLLASSGTDRKLLIWREQSIRNWSVIYELSESVFINCISFAPWELGLKLLAGLEDGSVLIISYKSAWMTEKFQGHSCSISSLAWGNPLSLHNSLQEPTFRFILGTSDGKIKICTQFEATLESEVLEKHTGCICDVAWNPCISSSREIFASAAERVVIIWVKSLDDPSWKAKDILSFPGPVWKISWNIIGNSLAISAADNYTRVVKENNEESWKVLQQISPKGEVTDLAES